MAEWYLARREDDADDAWEHVRGVSHADAAELFVASREYPLECDGSETEVLVKRADTAVAPPLRAFRVSVTIRCTAREVT